jgi:hypothetical protein
MRVRFGAILCLILGFVLIQGGLSTSSSSSVGTVSDPCTVTNSVAHIGTTGFCGLGELTVDELTTANGQDAPASWSLTLDTNCALPEGELATQPIDDGGTVTWDGLFVYTNDDRTEQCSYTLTEAAVPGFTATFTPPGPYTFDDEFNPDDAFKPAIAGLSQPVALANIGAAATTSASSSASSSASASASSSAAPTSAQATVPSTAPSFSSSSSPVLATTGPHRPVRGSLIAGIALVLFGGFLLIAGRRPRQARHG